MVMETGTHCRDLCHVLATFFMVIAWIALIHWNESQGVTAMIEGVGFIRAFTVSDSQLLAHDVLARESLIERLAVRMNRCRGTSTHRIRAAHHPACQLLCEDEHCHVMPWRPSRRSAVSRRRTGDAAL
jgi:hypothetical protein